jgi:hypothetical protein
VAKDLVRISEEEERQQGRPPSVWTVECWSVLDTEVGQINSIQQISDVMDPMRDGVLPEDTAAEPEDDARAASGA